MADYEVSAPTTTQPAAPTTGRAVGRSPEDLGRLAKRIRSLILRSTGQAGSGHPTSSLSATELMTALLFGGTFRYDPARPEHPNNDRLIFSKGHASPLLYALWAVAGQLTEDEVMGYRHFESPLEGHPSIRFRFTEAATGSLGQGLSIGVGMALNGRYLDHLPYRTWVLLGDSEMAEGSQWEAMELAARYKLDNLVGVIDVNRLGQRGPTMDGWDLDAYRRKLDAFGWRTFEVDGHSFEQIGEAYDEICAERDGRPAMVIARTVKGKGVAFVENKNGFHGKALEGEDLKRALDGLGEVEHDVRGTIAWPDDLEPQLRTTGEAPEPEYALGDEVPTRNAYGNAIDRLVERAAEHDGIAYLRTTRMATPVIYGPDETFTLGGSKVLRSSADDVATAVAAGVTLHEALCIVPAAGWRFSGCLTGASRGRKVGATSGKEPEATVLSTRGRMRDGPLPVAGGRHDEAHTDHRAGAAARSADAPRPDTRRPLP